MVALHVESANAWKRWGLLLFAIASIVFLYFGLQSSAAVSSATSFVDEEQVAEPVQYIPSESASHYAPEHLPESAPQPPSLHAPQPALQAGRPDPPVDEEGEFFDAMTTEQCHQHFPELYQDVHQRVAYWNNRSHQISEEDIDINWRDVDMGGGAMRILIHNNELRIIQSITSISHLGYHERALASLGLLQRALDSAMAAGETLPTVEAALLLEDISNPPTVDGTHSFWTFTANREEDHKRRWLMPNFDFWYAWPMGSYKDSRRRAIQYDSSFFTKIPKAVWRGNQRLNPDIREGLVAAAQGKEWANVEMVDWTPETQKNRMSVDDFCKYAFTIHTEGITYSGRLKYLLNCDSVPIIHELHWTTYWYHLLKKDGPDQNYVHMERNWTSLESTVQHYLDHPEEAQRIIQNSLATFRGKYLTRAAESCYTRELIRGYASVSFTPRLLRPERPDGLRRLRGYSFEAFSANPKDFNEITLEAADNAP